MTQKTSFFLAHVALFVVFFWFGALKVVGLSPATDLVHRLFDIIPVLNAMPFETFNILLGLVEMLIGVLFLFPKTTRLAVIILLPHMLTTVMPLFLLPDVSWQAPLVPTLVGQYIIKNVVIVALALSVILEGKK